MQRADAACFMCLCVCLSHRCRHCFYTILFLSHFNIFNVFFKFFERIHYKNISTNLTHNSILVIFCIVCHII